MTGTDLQALHDSDEHDTKEELVVFDNVLERYSSGDGITVGYSLGSRVCPTAVDWIGIFGSGCRDTRRPVTFQWVPIGLTDSQCPQHRFLTFPRRLIEPLQHPTYSYRLMYIHKHRIVLGVSSPFLVHEITINNNPKLRSPTSAGAGTTALVDLDERAAAASGDQTVAVSGEKAAIAVSSEKAATKHAERATVEPDYRVTAKQGEPAPAGIGVRASASGYAGWSTIISHQSVSPDGDWDYSRVSPGHGRPSALADFSDALALPSRPCMEAGQTHDKLEASGSKIAHVNDAGSSGMKQTDYSQHWRCRQPSENPGAVWESSCDSPTCRGNISAHFLGQNNRPLDIFLGTHHLTSMSVQQQKVSNISTQPQQYETTDTATQRHQNIDTSTHQQQTSDISIQPQQTRYTCLQKHQQPSVTQTVSQKLGAESPISMMPLTLLQQSSVNCGDGRVQLVQTNHAHCSQDNTKDNMDSGEGSLSIPVTAPNISTNIPEECRTHQQARPTIIGREIPTHEIILRYLDNAARLVPRTHEDTQCKDTRLDNELADNAAQDAKEANIACDLRNTHTRQQQQQQLCVPESKHCWSLQKQQYQHARPHLKSPSHRIGQVVTAGRGLLLYQKIRVKKKRKKPLHTELGTKVNSGALLTSRRGQASDTTTAVSETPATVVSGLMLQNGLDQAGQPLTRPKTWDTPTQDVLRLRLSEVSDTSAQPLTSVQSADATSRNRPSSQAHDTAPRSTGRDPDPKPGEHPHSTTLKCAVGRLLNARPYSRDLQMPAAGQAHIHTKDTGMPLKYQATAWLKDIKTQKELQNSFMREVQNLHDRPDGDSDTEPRRHVLYSGIAAHRSHSAECGPVCLDLSACAPCDSERLHVDPSRSDNRPQAANHGESQVNSQGPSENFSLEATSCDKLAGRDDKLAEKDNHRDSLSWPLPEPATMPSSLGPWATQKKMKYQPENYTKHELPLEADSEHSKQPAMNSRSAGLEPQEAVWGASGDIGHNSEQIAMEAEKTTRAVFLYGALMTSLADNMQLRHMLELVQMEAVDHTVRPHREQPQKAASARRRPGTCTVRHRRLPLVKHAGAIKNSVRCQEHILSLKSKVKHDDLLIRELNSQLSVLKDTLNTESCKVERAHHKFLKLKKKMKEYKEKMAALTRRKQMPNIDTPMDAVQKARARACLGDGDCRGMEPPLKKPRLTLESVAYMKDGTEAMIQPPVSEVGSVWQQQSCPLSQDAYNLVRRLPSDDNQLTPRSFTNVPSQHSTPGYTRNSTLSAFCHGSGFLSAFNATQQTAAQGACINAWSRGHLDAVVTPCHHSIIASSVRPVGSHRDNLPETDHKYKQQQTSTSCWSSQTSRRGHPSSECYTGSQSPTSSPAGGHCCSSSRQYQRAKPSCPRCYDSLVSASRHSAPQKHRISAHCQPARLPVMFTGFPHRSPLSCNNSRNKSRESSASDCQHISPLPSPCLLPLPASQNHWSGRGRRSSPRNEIVVNNQDMVDCHSASQQCVNSYVGESVQLCSRHASMGQHDSPVTDQYDTNLYWPSTPAEETGNYRQACAVYNLPDGDATRKHYSCPMEAGSMVKVHVEPFHASPTSVESEQFSDNMFAYASGATVCPAGNSIAHVSDSVCKLLTAADDEGGINNQLLGIFTTPQQVTHHGQDTSTMLHNVSSSLISANDLHTNSMYSHFQSSFLSHLAKHDSHKLQNTQLQSQDHPRVQNNQLQSQDPPRLQNTQLQSQAPHRLLGHKHYRQRQYVQKADQSQPRQQKVYRYPRTPLSLPPSELPYPPLSPFHHATSTHVRKTSALMVSDTDVEQPCNSILSERALLQRLPHSAFHGSHHSLGESALELPASSSMKQEDPFAIRRLLENTSSRDNPRSLVNLRTQSVRHVLNESALLASEALVESHVDDRHIEASPACQLNPQY